MYSTERSVKLSLMSNEQFSISRVNIAEGNETIDANVIHLVFSAYFSQMDIDIVN